MYIDQFIIMLSSQDDSILNYYIMMDKSCNQLTSHLKTIFTYLRNQAVQAIQNADMNGLMMNATYLQKILSNPDGCESFFQSQSFISSKDPKVIPLQFSQDYLAPFFGFHPADFFSSRNAVNVDISTIPAVNASRSEYITLMNNMEYSTVLSLLPSHSIEYSLSYYDTSIEE